MEEIALNQFRSIIGRAGARFLSPVLAIAAAGSVMSAAFVGVRRAVQPGEIAQHPIVELLSIRPALASSAVAADQPGSTFVAITDESVDAVSASPSRLNITGINHPGIDKWVTKLTTSLKRDLEISLGRMGHYSPMIARKLEARQMPRDLVYLPLIESNFNPSARSQASAVGLWQFMSATARRFGLKVDKGVDQRKDPNAATDAALTYLSSLYDRFGSWYLAAAAYNSGEGTVLRALKRVTGRTTGTDADFFKISPALPQETRDYVPKLIATARVGQNPQQYGLTPVVFHPPRVAAPTKAARGSRFAKSSGAKTRRAIKASRVHRTSRVADRGRTAKRSVPRESYRDRARR
jgi:membrane-bound lytic murein transglycosylase D